jgi:hypothetical protein
MNHENCEHEYIDWVEQSNNNNKYSPCDPFTGAYMLLDEASPDSTPKYFTSLDGAVTWAEGGQYMDYQGVAQWSVYRVGDKVL